MDTIRKITFLVLVPVLFSQCEINQEDEIPEGNVNIPDSNFLEVLIDEGLDTNNDGQISYAEAYEVTSLYFEGDVCLMCEDWCASRLDIESLEGIEAFVNLRRLSFSCTKIEHLNLPTLPTLTALFCMSDTLKSLDISKCTALRELTLGFSQLTSIDVSNNKNLEDFICHHNQLTTIDITKNTNLKFLDCSGNKLTKIDVTNNAALEDLRCSFNQITTIDVSHNTKLINFSCGGNPLKTLDVAINKDLKYFICHDCKLASIDITHNQALTQLVCSNNPLTSLDISNNNALTRLGLSDMPTLNKICVWEMPFPPQEVEIYTEGSPNIYFTLDCN
jgi:hypothetical protein